MNFFQEGGAVFMYPLLILLIIILYLIIKMFTIKNESLKTVKLISSISTFALFWGFLGQVLGLIQAFDFIQSIGAVSTEVLSAGLKVSFLPTAFGICILLVGRLAIIVNTLLNDK